MLSFNEEYEREKPASSCDLGIRDVEISEIRGSVGRYRDFEKGFNVTLIDDDERYGNIARALKKREELPPIELYRLKDSFFIVDGHHRVMIARRAGIKKLKARVIEFLPPKNSFENMLTHEKSEFELITGLDGINLTEISQYEKLLNQIRENKYYLSEKSEREVSFREAARDWYESVYVPIAARISEEGILQDFPGREIADLYVYISDHKWMESQQRGYDIGFAAALEEFHEQISGKTLREKLSLFFSNFFNLSPGRKQFEDCTGLRNINLSRDDSYTLLKKQIEEHKYYLSEKKREEVSLQEAAWHWRYEVFEPVKGILQEERHMSGFPRKTSCDLYIMLSELKWLESEKRGYDIGFDLAIEEMKKKQREESGRLRAKIRKLLKRLKEKLHNNEMP